jgi:hypothetical protein
MDKLLVVTDGSRGIGAATCRLAAGRGYAVCVNYVRNREAAAILWLLSEEASYATGAFIDLVGSR